MDAIFAPFVQAQSGHARNEEGGGLGLTISRRLGLSRALARSASQENRVSAMSH